MIPIVPQLKTMEIPQKLTEYINANRAGNVPITDPDEPLGIDSLGLIRLVGFMENDLDIRIEDEELQAENFQSLRAVTAFLATKSRIADGSKAAEQAL